MKYVDDLLPWKVTDISLRPYKGMWSFNPSIHFDGVTWRCTLRCCDYSMPEGITVRSDRAKRGETQTKNALVIFDPSDWRPVEIYKMRERDDTRRRSSKNLGFEDLRLFRTDDGGLQAIGAALHLDRDDGGRGPEQALLSVDDDYNIAAVRPIRGSWSALAQKNWAPFDHAAEPRFLYDIDRGTLFGTRGALHGQDALIRPGRSSSAISHAPSSRSRKRAGDRAVTAEQVRSREQRGRRSRSVTNSIGEIGHQVLRGGTQLVRVGDEAWLGIGHAMQMLDKRKYYWHTWYLVDARGSIKALSPPMKLAHKGIEFAAGLAIDGDRIVVSFGVDDLECKIGETRLSAVMDKLQEIGG